ncbi:MAG: HAD family hydrolase [Blautia sp.]
MKNREIRGVVFDMDGLMFDSERIVKYSWDVAGEEMGYGKLGDNIVNTLGFNVERRKAYFRKKYGEDFPFEQFRDTYRAAFHRYETEHGIPAKKGLHQIIKVLKECEIPMAVATSSSHDYAMNNLEREGIAGVFTCIITGGMVKEAKPSPEIYRKACEGLNIQPEYGLALEDSYNGIRSAHDAGMVTIMIPDLLKDSSPVDGILDGKMDSLLEAAEWIRSMYLLSLKR